MRTFFIQHNRIYLDRSHLTSEKLEARRAAAVVDVVAAGQRHRVVVALCARRVRPLRGEPRVMVRGAVRARRGPERVLEGAGGAC